MSLTYQKFLSLPVKQRIIFTKKLLNELGFELIENHIDDKVFKKALKSFQESNNFCGNCVVSNDVFYSLISKVPNHSVLWKSVVDVFMAILNLAIPVSILAIVSKDLLK